MADENLPLTGKDVFLDITLAGVPQGLGVQATSFVERARFEEIETRKLGTSEIDIDQVHVGWEGTIEFAQSGRGLEILIDAYIAARRGRLPVLLTITRTKNFRDGTSIPHTYPDVKITGFESASRRGQAGTVSMPWKSGLDRIAL
jgi:hypothetical protein